jgi:hypothetical protein
MALSIKNDTAERLARQVASETGESLTEAIIHSLEERLESLQKPAPTVEPPITISKWAEIAEHFDDFPPPKMAIDFEGEIAAKTWVFRGLKSSAYKLEPAIEREEKTKSIGWSALESLAKSEFKARARSHLSAALIPADGDELAELTWLAQMQHYGIPTRLLDFTYSPFVALYFAIRNGYEKSDRTHVRLWAVDAQAVNGRFGQVAGEAWRQEQKRKGRPFIRLAPMDDFSTQRDRVEAETKGLHALVGELLLATGTRSREGLNRSGCVCKASPPAFNPRLVSQQGAFLLNCAEELSFEASLTKMMEPCSGWAKTFDIPIDLIPEVERRLFQMNIHEQALFPDMEGLAGLIRQKIRFHWE